MLSGAGQNIALHVSASLFIPNLFPPILFLHIRELRAMSSDRSIFEMQRLFNDESHIGVGRKSSNRMQKSESMFVLHMMKWTLRTSGRGWNTQSYILSGCRPKRDSLKAFWALSWEDLKFCVRGTLLRGMSLTRTSTWFDELRFSMVLYTFKLPGCKCPLRCWKYFASVIRHAFRLMFPG